MTFMRAKVIAFYLIVVLGAVVILTLGVVTDQAGVIAMLAPFGIGMGLLSFFVRCPTCHKSVFWTERRRTVGVSVGFSHPWPETVCSRCGTVLISDPADV